jgi:hypothetical protein
MQIALPGPDGILQPYQPRDARPWPRPDGPPRCRLAYASAHVVPEVMSDPAAPVARLDWDATLRLRRHLWAYGLRVAEAMDAAHRNMGVDWPGSVELIGRSVSAARDFGDPAELVAAGVGTDHAGDVRDLSAVAAAYIDQLAAVRQAGAGVVVLPSRELAQIARGPEDYHKVYSEVLAQADRPVILHWLGEMLDSRLAGYWGSRDIWQASEVMLTLVRENATRVAGIRLSLLNAQHEAALRAALPSGVRLYTGDDYGYDALIASGSHAMLDIFDAIAPAAATALHALDAGDRLRYEQVLTPTIPLARKIFEPPAYHYRTGLAFVSWLTGHQDAFVMVHGAQAGRSLPHLAEVFRLADYAGLFPDPDLAAGRMSALLAQYGIA